MFSARSFSSGCRFGSLLTPVRARGAEDRAPALPRPLVPLTRAAPAAAATSAALPAGRVAPLRRDVLVLDALGRTAVALELRLDPVDRGAVAIGALAAIAELREPLDGGLVSLEIEARRPASESDLRAAVRRPAAKPVPGRLWVCDGAACAMVSELARATETALSIVKIVFRPARCTSHVERARHEHVAQSTSQARSTEHVARST